MPTALRSRTVTHGRNMAGARALLRAASPEFRDGWERHDVGGFESRERVFHHPTAGRLVFEHHQLRPSDRPDLQVVVYTRLDGAVALDRD